MNDLLQLWTVSALVVMFSVEPSTSQCDSCRVFPSSDFQGIDCSSMNLTSIPACITGNYTTISLEHNSISALAADSFQVLPVIISLGIYSNLISSLAPDSFVNVPSMSYVDLSSNLITEVPPELFSNTPNLTVIYLDGNRISSVHPDTFLNNGKLLILTLDRNLVTTLDAAVVAPLTGMRIGLVDNPWYCDCTTNALLTAFEAQEITMTYEVRCAEPRGLDGTVWTALPQLPCQ